MVGSSACSDSMFVELEVALAKLCLSFEQSSFLLLGLPLKVTFDFSELSLAKPFARSQSPYYFVLPRSLGGS